MKVLITAGTVYGRLDDNKLVGNRIRGIWASKFACWLAGHGHSVTLLLPDIFPREQLDRELKEAQLVSADKPEPGVALTALFHTGYDSYAEQCYALAPQVDAAVMAAAVVNWIPKTPFKGKMPTEGFAEGAEQLIPFVLAPRVIDRMKKLNPKLKLIGCKMTSGATKEDLHRAAYQTLLKAHCNVVVANDLSDLKVKRLVYPDGHSDAMTGFEKMYEDLAALLNDEFYRTETHGPHFQDVAAAKLDIASAEFDLICQSYREKFVKRPEGPYGPDRVFGSVAVRIDKTNFLVSPREKGTHFDSKDAAVVCEVDRPNRVVRTVRGKKATLNAPLLIAVLEKYNLNSVVHLHQEEMGWPTTPYGPPGTVRDNDRPLPGPNFNIAGHGCVFAPWK